MNRHFHFDYETSSEADLPEVGLYNYATHRSTKVLMMAYAFDDEDVKIWFPNVEPLPAEVEEAWWDPSVVLAAFSSPFERYISHHVLNFHLPTERFQDPQASARYLSLPAHLEEVGDVLGLPIELRKDKRGKDLMSMLSFPQTRTKKELKDNPELSPIYFNNHHTHPKEFAAYAEYCKQDVRAEREIARRLELLGVFPLPERERKIWLFDQKVNDRGMPTDRDFVVKAFAIADKNKEDKLRQQNELTGLDNANSAKQLLPWVQERGYPLNNLRKQNIELILKTPIKDIPENWPMQDGLTAECRTVLNARMEASSTSYKKLKTIINNLNPDNRLRGQFVYMGSPRCGRWSGAAVQPHNMARPDGVFEDLDVTRLARDYVNGENYLKLSTEFKKEAKRLLPGEDELYSPLVIIKNLIRTVFVAPPGKRFNVCDLNAIETRVGAWVAECESLLKVFEDKKDPYLDFAVKMTGMPYERLASDIKSKDAKIKALAKRIRQVAKPGVLGAIYRLGPGGWGYDKNGDRIKTGLWGYAESMGIDMTQEEAAQVVKIFRESYPEICSNGYKGTMKGIWVRLEEAVADVLNGERTVRKVGPDGCITIDKLTFGHDDNIRTLLRIRLPSGRYLHYLDAAMEVVKMPWRRKNEETGEMEDVYRPAFTYYGKDQQTDQWSMIVSHGGKIFENIVQGLSRDILAEGMLRIDATEMEICGHVHDEIIAVTDDDPFVPGALEMQKLMSDPMPWAATLPLGAEAWEDYFYHK